MSLETEYSGKELNTYVYDARGRTSMTQEQEAHVQGILKDFNEKAYAKYVAGQAEHGGNLFDMPKLKLIDCALEEAIDQYVYLYTLREKEIERLRKLDEQRRLADAS